MAASAASSAPSRASWAYELTEGRIANVSPAASPAQPDASLRPSNVITYAAAAMASAEGSRTISSLLPPNTRTTTQIST